MKTNITSNKQLTTILLIGILGGSTILGSMILFPNDKYIAFGQEAPNVMELKLNDAILTLNGCGQETPVCEQAIEQMLESLFISNLVVLPTVDVPETDQQFLDLTQRMNEAINALNDHTTSRATPDSKVAAAEARNFLQLMREATQVIAEQTRNCDPNNPAGAGCELLLADDEGGTFDIVSGFAREVRSPFFYGIPQLEPQENIIVPEPLANGECVPIIKETRGVKVVVRPVIIPIWIEPWFERASIVGFTTVWVWEFVPAEFVKTISYCNVGGTITQDIDMEIIRDRPLMHMWKFFS